MSDSPAPLVSVIIPCFGQAHYLGSAIESALRQTYAPIEVVVVDDGSPDDVAFIARTYPGVRLVVQANAGLSAARNAGVAASRGDFLVFLDADDVLAPDGIAAGMRVFLQHAGAALAFGRHERFADDGTFASSTHPVMGGDAYEALLRGNVIGGIASAVIRRNAFDGVDGFDRRVAAAEDYDFYLRVAKEHSLVQHDGVVAYVRRHDHGMHRDFAHMLKWTLTVLRNHRPSAGASPRLIAAYLHGEREWRQTYGHRLARKALSDLRSVPRWPAAARAAWTLARFDPLILARRLGWAR